MLEIIATSIIAVVLIILVRGKAGLSRLAEPRATMLTIGVQIICGDCSGNDERPLKTYLDRAGNCGQCGGRSYMLASNRSMHAKRVLMARLTQQGGLPGNACLEPFASSSTLSTTQIHGVTAWTASSLASVAAYTSERGSGAKAVVPQRTIQIDLDRIQSHPR